MPQVVNVPEPVVVDPVILPPWMTLPPPVVALVSIAFFAACAIVMYPLMRAIGQRIAGQRPADDAALREELASLRARVDELEGERARVHELEDRLDFAERLLAQQREPERLPRA